MRSNEEKGKISRAGGGAERTYQQEGPDVGDFVELHEESQSLLMVTAVLAVH